MASVSAVGLPSVFHCERKSQLVDLRNHQVPVAATHLGNPWNLPVPAGRAVPGRCLHIVPKAVGESSDSSGSIINYMKDAWNQSEDRIAVVGFGFTAIAVLWASSNLIGVIDNLPFVPGILKFIGILFSWWFIYRYLLFKPDRQELVEKVKGSLSDILGK